MSDYRGEPGTIVDLVQRDHNVIKGLLGRFDTSPVHEWAKLFQEFVDYSLRHEIAEAEVVFPAVRDNIEGSGAIVEECISEQQAMEASLAAMEGLDPGSIEFREALGTLRDDQSRHATHEEEVILPMLRGLKNADSEVLARSYDVARVVASRPPASPDGDEPRGATSVAALAARLRSLLSRG